MNKLEEEERRSYPECVMERFLKGRKHRKESNRQKKMRKFQVLHNHSSWSMKILYNEIVKGEKHMQGGMR